MITRVRNDKDYKVVMKSVESLLDTATKKGGFHKLSKVEASMLSKLSKMAEEYEDREMMLMPIKELMIR